MKLSWIIIIVCLYPFYILASPIATVNNYEITYQQLSEEMRNYEAQSDLSYAQIRKMALNKLINDQLLIIYAEKNGIIVDDLELETIFIQELGDLPRFTTDGFFDYDKFEEFKLTGTGIHILYEMRREILIKKVETLIKNSFNLTYDILLQRFISENTEIDINYALINVEKVNITSEFTPEKAVQYYLRNRNEFRSEKQVKLKFFIIQHDEFRNSAESYFSLLLEPYLSTDTTFSQVKIDSIKTDFVEQEIRKRSFIRAEDIKEMLDKNKPVPYDFLFSDFLGKNDNLGTLPHEIIIKALNMKAKQYSEPVDIGFGYIVFCVIDTKKSKQEKLEDVPEKIWDKYIVFQKEKSYSNEFKDYFIQNINDFIISVGVVKKIEIPESAHFFSIKNKEYQLKIKDLILQNKENEYALDILIDKYNLKSYNEIVYLEKFTNSNPVNEVISQKINEHIMSDFVQDESKMIFYKLTALFPEYIPNFKDIESQISDLKYINQVDLTEYEDFYNSHKKDFMTPDSLQLGGVFIPIYPDSILIDEEKIEDYYEKNIYNFYREKSVEFDYIFVKNEEFADQIRYYSISGVDFSLLQTCFSVDYSLPGQTPVIYDELPGIIKNTLSNMDDFSYSFPVHYDNGWFVFYKIRSYTEGLRKFSDVKEEISHKFKIDIADSIAFSKAKAIFDSTTYFSHCYQYADEENIFKTSFQETDLEYEKIGSIKEYKKDLMRIWKNEKYSSILKTDDGYAIIFQLNKKSARQINFENSLKKIKDIFAALNQVKTSKEFVNNLRKQIIGGANPDSLLFFLGGWDRVENLTLDSKIFGPEYSHLIIDDISKRKEGYYSPVISISENKLLFYHIDRLKKISEEIFSEQKDMFKEKIIKEKYSKWLNQFKATCNIRIRI